MQVFTSGGGTGSKGELIGVDFVGVDGGEIGRLARDGIGILSSCTGMPGGRYGVLTGFVALLENVNAFGAIIAGRYENILYSID
jgi:hypothetical protein